MTPAASSTTAAGADPAAKELAVMQPDITLQLGDESVVVREYSFWDGLDVVYSDGRAFLDDVVAGLAAGNADAWEQVRGLVGRHRGYLVRAIARAVDRDPEWVQGLAARNADALFSIWWAVNGHFFLHEATVVIRGRLVAKESAGPKSSPPSPAPDSAPPTASGTDTPGAS
ncbi:MAG TPA: hypothetical protein H9827_12390 [Candidatus Luteimonas excrementigallinarum]|nr:hypothetical protein [Candidatus Luteimonas excrementigallinarum]